MVRVWELVLKEGGNQTKATEKEQLTQHITNAREYEGCHRREELKVRTGDASTTGFHWVLCVGCSRPIIILPYIKNYYLGTGAVSPEGI